MPRARNIKPAFFENEYLAELAPLDRLLFIGLWTMADREGRLEDRPKRIKATILPYDDIDPDESLQRLHDSPEKFIIRYEVNGVRYIQVNNFTKHQKPHPNEVASTIPEPPYNLSTKDLPPKYEGLIPLDEGLTTLDILTQADCLQSDCSDFNSDSFNSDSLLSDSQKTMGSSVNTTTSSAPDDADVAIGAVPNDVPYVKIQNSYNQICVNLPKILNIVVERKKHTGARYRQYGYDAMITAFKKANDSAFMCGAGSRAWRADYDWIMKPTNFPMILEGKYDNDSRFAGKGREPPFGKFDTLSALGNIIDNEEKREASF